MCIVTSVHFRIQARDNAVYLEDISSKTCTRTPTGGTNCGLVPTLCALSTRKGKRHQRQMFVSFSILLRTELSDTQKSLPWGHRAGCVALTQLPSPSCSPHSTFVHSTNKSGCSEGLSQEGKKRLWQEDPSGTLCWAKWWVFLSQEGQTLTKSTSGFLLWSWPGRWLQTCPQCHCKMTCWVSVKRIGEQTCFLDLKHLGWATLIKSICWGGLLLSGSHYHTADFHAVSEDTGKESHPSDSPTIPSWSVHKLNCK